MTCKTWFVIFFATLNTACDFSPKELLAAQVFEASGPITVEEIRYFLSKMEPTLDGYKECMLREATDRAQKVGDPETLNPTTVELLPADKWSPMDKSGKRLVLTQVILNQAISPCTKGKSK